MKLDQFQRTLLANQHRILAKLSKGEDAKDHELQIDVLENGYESEYQLVDAAVLDQSQCAYVADVLQMFRALKASYNELKDKAGINQDDLRFLGFDGNDPVECQMMGYVQHFWATDRFSESAKDSDGGNSHMPMRHIYDAMLREYLQASKPYSLTREEIGRIAQAGRRTL